MALSDQQKEAVKRRAGYRCEYCRITHWELQVDHIIPRSGRRRGSASEIGADIDRPENLAAACAHCNRLKDDFTTGREPGFATAWKVAEIRAIRRPRGFGPLSVSIQAVTHATPPHHPTPAIGATIEQKPQGREEGSWRGSSRAKWPW